MGNLKEQIYANKLRLCSSESRLQQQTVSSSQIMEKLFEWRNNLLERKLRSMNLGANGGSNLPPFSQQPATVPSAPQLNHLYSIVNKKTVNNRKRDEMRRHTVNIVQSNLHNPNTVGGSFGLWQLQQAVTCDRPDKFPFILPRFFWRCKMEIL